MFYLDPRDLVTDALVERLMAALGSEGVVEGAQLLDILTQIISRMDSFPVFARDLDSLERAALGGALLTDATIRVLRMSGHTHTEFGYILESVPHGPLEQRVRSTELVPINFASAEELDMLPKIGGALAESIVSERHRSGPYLSIQDLVDRVDGIGSHTGESLAHTLSFRFPAAYPRVLPLERDLSEAIALLVSVTPGANVASRLTAALDQMATALAADSPIGLPEIPHTVGRDADREEFSSTAIEPLIGSDYFSRILELIDGAALSIDVCMFHIALPSPDHPTRRLLDGLLGAHHRGVTARVLLDRDRPTDPYGSTVINSPARDLLNQDEELCRFDDQSVLLHSKYLILDEQIVVLGSHNWSAGSFFAFDDLSMAVYSPDYAAHMTTRFNAQWIDAANSQ